MPYIKYINKNFNAKSLAKIEQAQEIIEELRLKGFDLTLRQLYYQFVARGLIPNTDKEYGKLSRIINDARLTGLIDWDCIVDRTRELKIRSHWDSPSEIVYAAAQSYHIDMWKDQKYRLEVWIEKDALTGIIQPICDQNDVPYFSCRGYNSQSAMWRSAQRTELYPDQQTIIFHLGDHDPSGIDMTRDIQDRFDLFCGMARVHVKRIALNMNQIKKLKPPPNPTKLSDTRARNYISEYGYESWELDALDPDYISDLIAMRIDSIRDDKLWNKNKVRKINEQDELFEIVENFTRKK